MNFERPAAASSGSGITVAFTSSTAVVGVAIARGGEVLAQRSVVTDRRHAEEITPMLAGVVEDAGLAISDLTRIVVDVGPGRYTGMRVGIATAKSLAFARSLPVLGVTSLELLGFAARGEGISGEVFAVIDARRDQVFAQRVSPTMGEHLVLSPTELAALLPSAVTLVGDGADRYADQWGDEVIVRSGISPSAAAAALLNGFGGPASAIQPVYLRDPDAAINIKTRHGVVKP